MSLYQLCKIFVVKSLGENHSKNVISSGLFSSRIQGHVLWQKSVGKVTLSI